MTTIGICGTGRLARVHARHLTQIEGIKLAGYDRDSESSKSFATEFNASPVESLAELIEISDAVLIVTPNDTHTELALQSIRGGKPTFIEKPISLNLAEAKQIEALSTELGVNVTVGHVVRFFPEFVKASDLVKKGAVGTPAANRMRRGGGLPVGNGNWFLDHKRSGGVFLDLAVHDFDWILANFGPVKHLYARSVGATTMSGADYGLCTLTLESGAIAHVEATWMDPAGGRVTFEVAGSAGLFEYDSRTVPSLRTAISGSSFLEANYTKEDDPFGRQMRSFVSSVVHNTPPAVPASEAVAALRVATAALESAQTGLVVDL